MFVYKISNSINNKVYIGQTSKNLKLRLQRHFHDSKKLDTHFARAIRLYGKENFQIELIDTASSQEELNYKEHYWINFYNSVENGYNETNSILKSGGNTYLSKTSEEMELIKEKIRQSKIGGKNPHSRKIKCKNFETNEELFFDSMAECKIYFHETNHQFISGRCLGKIKSLYKNTWGFAYQEKEYAKFSKKAKNTRAKKIYVLNLNTNESYVFNSYSEANKQLSINHKQIQKKMASSSNQEIVINNYKIKLLE